MLSALCEPTQGTADDNTLASGIKHDYRRLSERIGALAALGPGAHRLAQGEMVSVCPQGARLTVTDKFGRTTQFEQRGRNLECYDGRIRMRYEFVQGQLRQIMTKGPHRTVVQVNADGSTDMISFPQGSSPVHHHARARVR